MTPQWTVEVGYQPGLVDTMNEYSPVSSSEVGLSIGEQFGLHVMELQRPTVTLVNSKHPEERVRIRERGSESLVEYLSEQGTEWETLTAVRSRGEAARKAAAIQEFEYRTERCEETGLQNVILVPGEDGLLSVDSLDELPIHIVEVDSNPFEDGRVEYLLEAPSSETQAAIEHPEYSIRTRQHPDAKWQVAHTTDESVKPGVAIEEFGNIVGFRTLNNSMQAERTPGYTGGVSNQDSRGAAGD
jgi:hypothetical protein